MIGTSVTLPFDHGKFLLGTWQRVVLVELDVKYMYLKPGQ